MFDEFESDFIIAASAKGFAFIPIKMLASMHTQYNDGYYDVVFVTVSGQKYLYSAFEEFQDALDVCEMQMDKISKYNKACALGKES